MASLYKKTINGKPCWYLREMARVGGRPTMVSEWYLGSGAELETLLDAREAAPSPAHTRYLGFGDVPAVWAMLDRLDVIGVIDSVVVGRRSDAGASVGTYLALAMTTLATNNAPIAQRGKAKQKRTDLRLVGLGLAVTRDGGVPLVSHVYPGNRPDMTQFPTMIDPLSARHTAQAAGFAQTLAKAQSRLAELTDTLARGKTRRNADQTTPTQNQLTATFNPTARAPNS